MKTSTFTKQGIWLIVFLLAVIFVAIITTLATERFLDSYADSLETGSAFDARANVKPASPPGTYEEALLAPRAAAQNSIAYLLAKSEDSVIASEWKNQTDALAYGVPVTSDGWVLFSAVALPDLADFSVDYEIWLSGERYAIEQVVPDTLTDTVMVNTNGSAFTTIDFGSSASVRAGERLFALAGSEFFVTTLANAEYLPGEMITKAEVFGREWLLSDEFSGGEPILNSEGALVAFAGGGGSALPFQDIYPFVQSVLEYGESRRAGLGVYVVDIDSIFNLSNALTLGTPAGALIRAPLSGASALVGGSPLIESKLKEGDIILSVDGALIQKEKTIATILADYVPGDLVTLLIKTAVGEKEISVTLVNYQDLLY